jgi:cytoskeletal protein CcmA (bactofilin family)
MATAPTRGSLYIGQGVIANGTISVPGEAVIDGEMIGTIKADQIVVGKGGKLTANAEANVVDVAGEVTQQTIANVSLRIQSTGIVAGNISYGDLEIMKGGEIIGTINQTARPPK